MMPTDSLKPAETPAPMDPAAPPLPAPRHEATVRLIQSQLADEERTRAKRWWRFTL